MNKLIIAFITVLIFLTGVILITQPKLHKTAMFSKFSTQTENISEQIIEQETKIVHVQQTQTQETIKLKPQQIDVIEKQLKTKNIQPGIISQHTQLQNKNLTKTEQKPKYELPKSIQDIANNKQPQTPSEEKNIKITEPPVKEVPNIKPTPQKPQEIKQNTPLTEEEEVIVWNKWRSDLQNKVMRESRLAAEHGTVFRFSFTVNKFGQISNLKIWSDTPAYTNYAVQQLKPLLLSYQGQAILNFPPRTKRITTNVTGAFVLSNQDKYSTPADYSDIERVRN